MASYFGIQKVSEGTDGLKEHEIPIDIPYANLLDWLVDRKRISRAWADELVALQARVRAAIAAHPPPDHWLRELELLGVDSVVSFERCKQALELLLRTPGRDTSTSRSGFLLRTTYNDAALREWADIVSVYQGRNNLHLSAAARSIITTVSYTLPALRKSAEQVVRQIGDAERKELEYERRSAEYLEQYSKQCAELGIAGEDIPRELLALVRELDGYFEQTAKLAQQPLVSQALAHYTAFTKYLLADVDLVPQPICPILSYINKYGNESVATMEARLASADPDTYQPLPEDEAPAALQPDAATQQQQQHHDEDQIDFDIDLPTEAPVAELAVVDFDVGELHLAAPDEGASSAAAVAAAATATAGGDINWDLDLDTDQWQITTEAAGDAGASGATLEIDWDLGPTDGGALSSVAATVGSGTGRAATGGTGKHSILQDARLRVSFCTDLLELQAFLDQLVLQSKAAENAVYTGSVTTDKITMVDVETIQSYKRVIDEMVAYSQNSRFQMIQEIQGSARYVERLTNDIRHKIDTSRHLKALTEEARFKQRELEATRAAIAPQIEALRGEVRQLKAFVEKELSVQNSNRPVHLTGEIGHI